MSGFTPDSPEFQAWLAEQERSKATLFDAPKPSDYVDMGAVLSEDGQPLRLSDVRKGKKGESQDNEPLAISDHIDARIRNPSGMGSMTLAERARARTEALFNVKFRVPELDDPDTGEEFTATIKQPDMTMLLEAKAIPTTIRQQINQFLKDREDISGSDGTPDTDKIMDAVNDDLIGSLSEIMGVADVICVESFVDPRLVWTQEEEVRDPAGCLWYKRIPLSARQRLWGMMRGVQEASQKTVATFPDGSESAVRTEGDIEIPEP